MKAKLKNSFHQCYFFGVQEDLVYAQGLRTITLYIFFLLGM